MTETILKSGDTFNAYLKKEHKGRLAIGAPFIMLNHSGYVINATDAKNGKRIFVKNDFEFVIISRKKSKEG